jgi:hypothetical protein
VADVIAACLHLAEAAEGWSRWLAQAAADAAELHDRGLAEGDLAAAVARARRGLRALAEELRRAHEAAGDVPDALATFGRVT